MVGPSRPSIVVVMVMIALIGASRCGRGSTTPTAPTTTRLPVSVDVPVAPSPPTPGLYQDGQGMYRQGDTVFFSGSSGSSLFLNPNCIGSSPVPRELNLVLPQEARDVVVGRLSTCVASGGGGSEEAIFLHVPALLSLPTGAVVAPGGAGPNSSTAGSIFLFLRVDSNGDGTIRVDTDEQYNIRWQRGIYLRQRSETATTIVYDLTSLATQFGPDLSCNAEVILRNTPMGEVSKGLYCVPLVLTVTLHK